MSDGVTDAHLLLAFEGTSVPPGFADRLTSDPVAGVSLFVAANVADAAQVRTLTDDLQRARPEGAPPLLIAADHEGGQFLGLGRDVTAFAGNLALGAVDDPDLTERVAAAMGREALALGVNVDYAPNVDLLLSAANPSIGIRSFGDEAPAVAQHAAAFVRGLRSVGVVATPKHAPGVGAAEVDSHHQLGTIEVPRDVLERRELAVLRAVVAADPGLLMTGHVAVPALTGDAETPATLSRDLVTGLLRTELGYDGVVVTDALDMRALAQGEGRVSAVIAALHAGVDLLLCAPEEDANERLRAALRRASADGRLDPQALAASRARIDRLRRSVAGTDQPPLDVVGCAGHRMLAAELARRSITLARDEAGALPLRPEQRVLVLEPRPRNVTPADTTEAAEPLVATSLRRHLPHVDEVVYDDPPSGADVTAVLARAAEADLVVLGTSAAHLTPAQLTLGRAVLARGLPTVHVALRTPHDVAHLPAATALCTYGIQPPTVAALADVLVGVASAPGRLPVRVEVDRAVGA